MAIIDILTHYDAKKKAAHAAKTVKHGVSISVWFPSLLPASSHAGARAGPLLSWELPSPFHGSGSLWGCTPTQSQSSQGLWQVTWTLRGSSLTHWGC